MKLPRRYDLSKVMGALIHGIFRCYVIPIPILLSGLATADVSVTTAPRGIYKVKVAGKPVNRDQSRTYFGIQLLPDKRFHGVAGSFEMAVKQSVGTSGATWIGEEISLLIKTSNIAEFLVARFKNHEFQADSDTGLESLVSLHLADARLIVGNRFGMNRIATSIAPETASFESWIHGFSSITDPAKRLRIADADGDGRSNFLEYATGGDPASAMDSPVCELVEDEGEIWWIRFARASGVGSIEFQVETSGDLATPWQAIGGNVQIDPSTPPQGNPIWVRIPVPSPMIPAGFFRLKVHSGDE